jgi:two-component system repressor protein LuxO
MSTLNEDLYVAAGLETEEQALRPLKTLEEFERDYIEMVVFICQGNIPKAAKILDISPSTLYRKFADWNKEPPSLREKTAQTGD